MTKLIDVQKTSIKRFFDEARGCAAKQWGFAAMLTTFPVILSVSEAVYYHQSGSISSPPNDKDLFKYFAASMADKTWLVPRVPNSSSSDQDIAIKLSQTRDGLVHQLSLPNYIGMVNTKTDVKEFFKKNPAAKYVISVVEFVEAAKQTVEQIIQTYPNISFDPNPKGNPRTPADRVILPDGTSGSAASKLTI